jgi:DNA-binding MarR family transcriptional regulator
MAAAASFSTSPDSAYSPDDNERGAAAPRFFCPPPGRVPAIRVPAFKSHTLEPALSVLTNRQKWLKSFRLENISIWKNLMETSQTIADEFVDLVGRLMRVRPQLVFQDESIARLKAQLQDLKATGAGNHEDRIFLFRILGRLADSETSPTMGELSAQLGIPLSSATRMADGLVRAKFVERCDDPRDRRVVRLCITKKGQQFIQAGKGFLKAKIVQLLDRFTPEEQHQLLRLMNKLIDSIEAEIA